MPYFDQHDVGAEIQGCLREVHDVPYLQQVDHRASLAGGAQRIETITRQAVKQFLDTGRKDIHMGQGPGQDGVPICLAARTAGVRHRHVQRCCRAIGVSPLHELNHGASAVSIHLAEERRIAQVKDACVRKK